MENKPDVKAMMARFQTNGPSAEDAPSIGPGRLKPLHQVQAQHTKKPVSGAAIPPKPSLFKPKSDTVGQEPNTTKALASKFANSQEETTSPFHKFTSKPSFTQQFEPKAPLNKPGVSSAETKPAVSSTKPSAGPPAPPTAPKIPPAQLKPNNSFLKLQRQIEANVLNTKAEVIPDFANKSAFPIIPAVKPPSHIKAAQSLFDREAEQDSKLPRSVSGAAPPPKPPASKKPSLKKASPHGRDSDPSAPRRNPLTNSLALGPAPAKPNRPPNVDLEVYKRGGGAPAEDPQKTIAPPPPSHPSDHSNHATPAPPPVPSLPPRHPAAINQTEEFYDDVASVPPPLPPVHPSQMSKENDEDEDGEMYEDLDERWEAAEQKHDKRKGKDDKEERKREKKEQESRKKFKLVGALEVLQKGKACVDFKGNKSDLSLKQGDTLDIIRIHGNPEGKWLGRSKDGSIGYVKITSVKIDYNSLKQQVAEQTYEPDLYDDIDTATPEKSKTKFPEAGGGEDIYDDVDPVADVGPSEPLQPPLKTTRVLQWMLERSKRAPSTKVLHTPSQFSGHAEKAGAIDEEIYDDVDAQNLPPPLPPTTSISRADPKKLKKFEKEEKEFRKKFKYDDDITVLHQVTVVPNLTNRKWSNKELPLKAGDTLDVIVKADDNKLICRNEDGKFGYVSTSFIVTDDGDIYDDIGDDCIYDND